jgi:hypothetical protein
MWAWRVSVVLPSTPLIIAHAPTRAVQTNRTNTLPPSPCTGWQRQWRSTPQPKSIAESWCAEAPLVRRRDEAVT